MGVIPALVFGWLAFFLPRPYAVVAIVGLAGFASLVGPVLFVVASRHAKLCERGIVVPTGFISWKDIRTYEFGEPGVVALTVVERTLNMVESTKGFTFRPELRSEVEEIMKRCAPTATRLQ